MKKLLFHKTHNKRNGPPNNFYEGNFSIFNSNYGLNIKPYEADLNNDNIEDLLLVDGLPYKQENFNNFKINILFSDIRFKSNNPSYIIDGLVCGQNRWSISQDIFPNLLDKTLN